MAKNIFEQLMSAVQKQEKAADKADTQAILLDGVDAWNDAIDALSSIPAELLEVAKAGGSIYAEPIGVYERIQQAVKAMLEAKHGLSLVEKEYEGYTGVKFRTVLEHNADSSRKIMKSSTVTMPKLKELRSRREALTTELDTKDIQYRIAESKIDKLPAAQQDKLFPLLEQASSELELLEIEISGLNFNIVDITNWCKQLEIEHGYTYDTNGKRVYNKQSEFNTEHRELVKQGRTALTEFKRFEKLSGLESVIPMAEVKKAASLFGMGK